MPVIDGANAQEVQTNALHRFWLLAFDIARWPFPVNGRTGSLSVGSAFGRFADPCRRWPGEGRAVQQDAIAAHPVFRLLLLDRHCCDARGRRLLSVVPRQRPDYRREEADPV